MPDPHDQIYAQIKEDIAGAAGKTTPEPAPAMKPFVTDEWGTGAEEYFASPFGQFVQQLAEGPPRAVEAEPGFIGGGIMGAYTPAGAVDAIGPFEGILVNPASPAGPGEIPSALTHEMGHAFVNRFGIERTFDPQRKMQKADLERQARRAGVDLGATPGFIDRVSDMTEAGVHWLTAYGAAGPGFEYSADVFRRAADYLWATRERTPEQFAKGLELLEEQQPGIVGMINVLREERGPVFEAMGHPIAGEKEPGFLTRVVRTVGDIVRQRGPQYETSRWSTPKEVAAHEQWEGKTRAWRERRDLIGEAMRSKGGK